MKIGVVSDSHGELFGIRQAITVAEGVSAWLHLGDFASDAVCMREMTDMPIYFVKGNCDGNAQYDVERVVELAGARLFIAHGHTLNVNYTVSDLAYRAMEQNCTAALFGHTHMPHLSADGKLLILNPGSVTRPIGVKDRSFAVLTIENGDINAKIIAL